MQCGVHGRGRARTQAEIGHSGSLTLLELGRHPVDAANDIGDHAIAIAVEHPNRNQRYPLGHTIACPPDDTGDMRSVAVTVLSSLLVLDGAESGQYPSGQLLVGRADTGINDKDADTVARIGVLVATIER